MTNLKETFNEKGEAVSPLLPEEIKNFLIDIDGTICDDVPNEEAERMATVLKNISLNIMESFLENLVVGIIIG